MKKLLLILLCLPMIGFSQFGKYTSNGQAGAYWNALSYPGWMGDAMRINAKAYYTDNPYYSFYNNNNPDTSIVDSIVNYMLIRGSAGVFCNFKSRLVFNQRINLAADYFFYYPNEWWSSNSSGSGSSTDDNEYISTINKFGEDMESGGNTNGYLRLTTGIGIPLWYNKYTSTDFNINNIMYLGGSPANTIDINFTYNAILCQVVVGYETSAKLSANFRNFYLTDDKNNRLEDSENYVQFPNFYISLRAALSFPFGKGTFKDGGANALKPTNGCIKGNCNNGKGVYVDNKGRYKGRFKNGEHHGQGVMRFSDGSSYDGKWRAGNRHGKGTYVSRYKEELAGDWVDDEFADPKLKPELTIRNIVFKDNDGDDEIYAEESGRINFYLENIGKGTAYNIIFTIKDLNNIKGLEFEKRIRIEKLKSGNKEKISIPVTSNLDLKTGLVNIKIRAEELNGFPPDDFSINFKSLAYINPDLKIIDYHFSSLEEGQNKLLVNDRASLTFIVQNRGQGRAQDIVVNLDFTSDENIFNVDEKLFTIGSLSPNESRKIDFEFFTNSKFNKKNIGISVDVTEKFNKYGDSKVLSQEIGEDIRSNLTVNYDGGNNREEVIIDNLSLTSLVDKNIPTNSKVNNRFALVIGNEDYASSQSGLQKEQNVDYAVNDAMIFEQYALRTLGVKSENMFSITNATSGIMSQEIKKVIKLTELEGKDAELIIYYAGHGFPDEQKVPHLIPVDVSGGDLSRAINLQELYKDLGNLKAKKVTVFLDACFTGGGRESGLMASRGVKVKPKEGSLGGNLVVFSASSGDQSSLPFNKEKHGVFTYHLLKALQDSEGDISYGNLYDAINIKVNKTSLRNQGMEQTPKVNTSSKVVNDWRNWKF